MRASKLFPRVSMLRRRDSADSKPADDDDDDDDDEALPRQRSRTWCKLKPGPAVDRLRFVPDKWPPTIAFHEADDDDSSEDEGDGMWSHFDPRPSLVGRECESRAAGAPPPFPFVAPPRDPLGSPLSFPLG